jgi:uroporphyrinogen decarboxylase
MNLVYKLKGDVMMNSKEIVSRAIEMTGPERVPLNIVRDNESDVVFIMYRPADGFDVGDRKYSEWGYVWERIDNTMGQPKIFPLTDWSKLKDYKPPDAFAEGRTEGFEDFIDKNKDKYILGAMGVTGFNQMTFIRGFSNLLEDLYLERENASKLADKVFGFEEDIIKLYGKFDIDAVTFYDDWGTQNSLIISPTLWRDFFKPRYKRQFDLIHSLNMHVYFHSCGYCYDIIDDLIEIGADILNFNQPDVYGVEKLGKEFGGRVCFQCPVDIQTVAINGGKKEIYDYVKRLIASLGRFNGGYIGLVEDYHSTGFVSKDAQEYCIQAFKDLGKY